jgi:short-subunit dehydrogenase
MFIIRARLARILIMANLTGKTALITGASVGIGRDLAECFARGGHHLVLTARSQSHLDEVAAKLRDAHGVRVEVIAKDLSIAGAGQELFDQISSMKVEIEFLVNNAGFGTHGPFGEAEVLPQLAMLQVNVVALTHLTRLFLPAMLARKGGRVLNVASTASFLPGPLMAVYYASKAYVLSFSEAVDAEVTGSGVTITALCPGPTITEFQKRMGVENSLLFRKNTMTSQAVAEIGYHAMMAGKRVAVAGFKNSFLVAAMKFSPRKWTAGVAKKLNAGR